MSQIHSPDATGLTTSMLFLERASVRVSEETFESPSGYLPLFFWSQVPFPAVSLSTMWVLMQQMHKPVFE
jgi:hypothetical protein